MHSNKDAIPGFLKFNETQWQNIEVSISDF